MVDWSRLEGEVRDQILRLEDLRRELARARDASVDNGRSDEELEGAFLDLLSHEIRTPLTSTIGYMDLVLGGDTGDLNDEQRECLAVARRNATRVLALVTDLVVIARAEEGWLRFAPQPLNLALIVTDCAELCAQVTDPSDVEVVTRAPHALDVTGDPEALRHALSSLVSRAMRRAQGGGRVEVSVTQAGASALVDIAHSGRALPPDAGAVLEAIMSREANAVADAVHGAGLELASAKAVVDAHGGRLQSGGASAGTSLRVELPLADLADPPDEAPGSDLEQR